MVDMTFTFVQLLTFTVLITNFTVVQLITNFYRYQFWIGLAYTQRIFFNL